MAGPKLSGTIDLDDSKASAALRRLGNAGAAAAAKLDADMGKAFKGVAIGAAAAAAAATAAFAAGAAAIGAGVAKQFEAGRALQILSRQTGASVGGLALLQEKFRTAGLSADSMGTAIARLQKSIAGIENDDNKGSGKAIQKLGLNLAALQKLHPDQQFLAVGAALSKIRDPAERAGDAMAIFGRSGAQLLTVFNGNFGAMPQRVFQQAQILARNAAIFEQVAIRLERVGEIGSSFFAGVAERVSSTLLPILDQLDRVNLVGIGQRFGDKMAQAAQILTGMFAKPELLTAGLENALKYSFAESANVLMAGMRAAAEFARTGLGAAFEGLGDTIISALMRGFKGPLAYLQANLENLLEESDPASKKVQYRDPQHEAELQAKVNYNADLYKHPERRTAAETWMDSVRGKTPFDNLAEANRNLADYQKLPVKESVESRYNRILKDGPRFGLVDGGQTAGQYGERASSRMGDAYHAAAAAFRNNPVEDVMGAGRFANRFSQTTAAAQHAGAVALGQITPGPTYNQVADSEVSSLNHRPETRPTYRAATSPDPARRLEPSVPDASNRPLSAPSTPVPAAPWSVGGSWIGQMIGNLVSPASYGTGGDTGGGFAGVAAAAAASPAFKGLDPLHTVGMGGALDFDPSTKPGWTGATNVGSNGTSLAPFANQTALSTGGLGGGAYGNTGPIWTQLSGRSNSAKSPEQQQVAILGGIHGKMDELVEIWKSGGSGGGTSGATATK